MAVTPSTAAISEGLGDAHHGHTARTCPRLGAGRLRPRCPSGRLGAIVRHRAPARRGPVRVSCAALERPPAAAGGAGVLPQSANTACLLVPPPIMCFVHHPRGHGRSHAGLTGLWYPFSVRPSRILSCWALPGTVGFCMGARGAPWCLTRHRARVCLARSERPAFSPTSCPIDASQLVYILCLPRSDGGLPLPHRRHEHCHRPHHTLNPSLRARPLLATKPRPRPPATRCRRRAPHSRLCHGVAGWCVPPCREV